MKKIWMTGIMLAALLGCVTAFGQAATNASPLSKADEEFVTKAQKSGLLEVEAGNLASQKATNPEVKSFGQQMVTDHQKANDRLNQIAQQKGLSATAQMDEKHQKKIQKLSEKTGAEFDKAYIDEMIKEHKKDVEEYSKAAKDAKDPDLRSFAAETVPILEGHLQKITDIKSRHGSEEKGSTTQEKSTTEGQ
jgi:putative membrane protein